VSISRRNNYIFATLYTCYYVWVTVWYAGWNVSFHPAYHRIKSTKCRINTVVPPDDGHIVARNMYRKEINVLRKIVHQIGFIYKIIQGCRSTKHKIMPLCVLFI